MKYLKLEHVIRIHQRVLERTGGHAGIRDRGAIESALAQPRLSFAGASLYPTLAHKAAALGYFLNRSHPFVEGNKRTSHAVMEMFLLRNGFEIEAPVDEQEAVFLRVAAGHLTKDEFTEWVKTRMVKQKKRRGR